MYINLDLELNVVHYQSLENTHTKETHFLLFSFPLSACITLY